MTLDELIGRLTAMPARHRTAEVRFYSDAGDVEFLVTGVESNADTGETVVLITGDPS